MKKIGRTILKTDLCQVRGTCMSFTLLLFYYYYCNLIIYFYQLGKMDNTYIVHFMKWMSICIGPPQGGGGSEEPMVLGPGIHVNNTSVYIRKMFGARI